MCLLQKHLNQHLPLMPLAQDQNPCHRNQITYLQRPHHATVSVRNGPEPNRAETCATST